MSSKLGEKLARLRKERNMTLENVAQIIESSRSYVWELENKDNKRPSAQKLAVLAKVYDVTTEFLLDDDKDEVGVDVFDKAFFRKYSKLPQKTKRKLNDIMKVLEKDD